MGGWSLALLAWALPVHAQSVAGIVVDPQERRVAGAPVDLACADRTRRTTTDGQGRFAFDREGAVEACALRVAVPGFAPVLVPLESGAATPQVIRLAIEAVAETVDVLAAAAPAAIRGPLTGRQARAISDDPADILRFAKAWAGPTAGHVVYVDGLPAERLPPVSSMATVAVNADPFSAEYSDPGRQRIDITTSAPDRRWRFDLGGAPGAIGGVSPLGERLRVRSLHTGLAGPSPWAGGALSIHASADALENRLVVVAAEPGGRTDTVRTAPCATIRQALSFQISQSLRAAGTLRVDGSRTVDRTSNAGVGGEVVPEAGHSSQATATELRILARRDWTAVSWRNRVLAGRDTYLTRATSTTGGVQVPGAFVAGGAALTASAADRTRILWRSVVEAPAARLPWRVGMAVERAFQQSAQTPNQSGSILADATEAWRDIADGQISGTLLRFAGPTRQRVALVEVALFADATILQWSHLRLAAGARLDWQSRDRVRLSPRFSAAGQARGWTLTGGTGWFTQTWRPELFLGTGAAAGAAPVQVMSRWGAAEDPAGAATAGQPIAMSLASGLTRPAYFMTSQAAERPLGRFTAGVEHVWWRGRHLLGARRLPVATGDGWIDWLESNRSIDSHEVRARLEIGDRRCSVSAAYAWIHSADDTDGPWSFPAGQGELAAERARSARIAPHNLDLVAAASLPLGLRLTAIVLIRGASPYNIVSGLDAERNGLFTDRSGLPRNSGRLPGHRSVALYLSRRFDLARLVGPRVNVPIDGGVQFENVLGARTWTTVGNVTGSPLFGRPEGAMPGRSVRVWFALAR